MINKIKRLILRVVRAAHAYLWRLVTFHRKHPCKICGSDASPRVAYSRRLLQCEHCGFVSSVDLHSDEITEGMGMTGSWSGPGGGGYREYFLVRKLAEDLGMERFLLFGTGNTPTFAKLLSEGIDVVGCDISRDVVEYKCREHGPSRFMLPEELPENAFDAIVAVEVFEHFADPAAEIKLLTRCLKPGGIIAGTTDFNSGTIRDSNSPGYMSLTSHVAYWSEKSMSLAFQPHGLVTSLFELIRPGSVLPDEKFNQLWPNKRVFFVYPDKFEGYFSDLQASTPILPIDKA